MVSDTDAPRFEAQLGVVVETVVPEKDVSAGLDDGRCVLDACREELGPERRRVPASHGIRKSNAG